MPDAFDHLLCLKLCRHNRPEPNGSYFSDEINFLLIETAVMQLMIKEMINISTRGRLDVTSTEYMDFFA